MANPIKHNGFDLQFDESREEWYVNIDGILNYNTSLKKLKLLLDKFSKKKFKRLSIFMPTNRHNYRSSDDEEYTPQYQKSEITSISPNGNVYVVVEGEKHASKENGRWGSFILDTPENRKLIKQYEDEGENEFNAGRAQEKIEKKLKKVEGKKLYKDVYKTELE